MNGPARAGTAIGPQEALDLFRTAMPAVAASGGARIAAHIAGSVNRIFRVETSAASFALRVRHNEANFLYEKGLFKEVIAARLIQAFERDTPAECGAALARIWHSTVQTRSAGPVEFPPGANILYYDFTGSIHPAPWAVFQWCGDALGAGFDAAHAHALGRAVARMHRLKFDCAYASLDRAGSRDILLEWTHEILRRNSATGSIVAGGPSLQRKLEALRRASEPVREFVFCHNDLHCLNVTASDRGLHIVDWDNAQIAPKELDFVKLAYWSKPGPSGRFQPDAGIFCAFCAGYGIEEDEIRSSPVFKLAEILWLFRVFEFTRKMPDNLDAKPPFWQASQYQDLLLQKLGQI